MPGGRIGRYDLIVRPAISIRDVVKNPTGKRILACGAVALIGWFAFAIWHPTAAFLAIVGVFVLLELFNFGVRVSGRRR